MPNFTISRNLESGLLKRESGAYVRALANEPLSSVGDGMRFPLLVQNVFRNSEPASDPGQGTRDFLSYVATPVPFMQLDGGVVLDNLSGTRRVRYLNVSTAHTGGQYVTHLFVAKSADGAKPDVGIGVTKQVRTNVGGTAGTGSVVVQEINLGDGWWYFQVSMLSDGTANTNTGWEQREEYTGGQPATVSGMMVLYSSAQLPPIPLADYIRTTGSAVTGVFPDISQNIGAWGDITFLMEVDLPSDIPSLANRLFNWGSIINDSVRGIYNANGFVTLQYLVGGSVIFELTTSPVVQTGIKRIAMKVSSGNNRLYINGVLIGSNTSVLTPTDYDPLKLGANLTGTGNRLQDAWFREFNIVPFMSDADAQAWTQP